MAVLLFIFLLISLTDSVHIILTNSHQLDQLLCRQPSQLLPQDQLLLYTNFTHQITSGNYCTVNIATSLVISSYDPVKPATIQCISPHNTAQAYPTNGFVFTTGTNFIQNYISSLSIERVNFINCGANLTLLDKVLLNSINTTSSPLYFTEYHAAVLIFTETLHSVALNNVTISSYYGFAIVTINTLNGSFHSVKIKSSKNTILVHDTGKSVGSGFLILFRNNRNRPKNSLPIKYQLSLKEVTVTANYESILNYQCISNLYKSSLTGRTPIVNAAGLTILYSQRDHAALVKIAKSSFSHNFGSLAGAILIIHHNSYSTSVTTIKGTSFKFNSILSTKCNGGALAIIVYFDKNLLIPSGSDTYHPLVVTDTIFYGNGIGVVAAGAVFMTIINTLSLPIQFHFQEVAFSYNFVATTGSCLLAYTTGSNNVELVLESVTAQSNSVLIPNGYKLSSPRYLMSLFKIIDFRAVIISGTSETLGKFSQNYGSVFEVIRSNIVLQGSLNFSGNFGNKGGAILLLGSNHIYLTQGLRATFASNIAQSMGGAIYAFNGDSYTKEMCTFQFDDYDNISVTFTGNRATVAGNSVYSTSLYDCYIRNTTVVTSNEELVRIYKTLFNDSVKTILSTDAASIKTCYDVRSYHGFPGKPFHIPLAAMDPLGNPAHAIISVSAALATYEEGPKDINWWFTEREVTQVIREDVKCTIIDVTVHTVDVSTLQIRGEAGFLLFSLSNTNQVQWVNINIATCPTGFVLDIVHTGVCICSPVVSKLSNHPKFHPMCDITTESFSRPFPNSWAGLVQSVKTNNTVLGVSSYCYFGYCNTESTFDKLIVNSSGTFTHCSHSLVTESLCKWNRSGRLCGHCQVGLSVVFGSNECRQCSNWWILTLLVYTAAGPLLVYLLYAFKLTLADGTLNGIIFYAQATNVGVLSYLSNRKLCVLEEFLAHSCQV